MKPDPTLNACVIYAEIPYSLILALGERLHRERGVDPCSRKYLRVREDRGSRIGDEVIRKLRLWVKLSSFRRVQLMMTRSNVQNCPLQVFGVSLGPECRLQNCSQVCELDMMVAAPWTDCSRCTLGHGALGKSVRQHQHTSYYYWWIGGPRSTWGRIRSNLRQIAESFNPTPVKVAGSPKHDSYSWFISSVFPFKNDATLGYNITQRGVVLFRFCTWVCP